MEAGLVVEEWQSQSSRGDFIARFAALPDAVRREPYRIGLLSAPLLQKLVAMPWPAPKNFFIASLDGKTIASIGASLSVRYTGLGFIGFYECDLSHPLAGEASRRLIEAAEQFLRDHKADRIIAPVNYSTWFPYRFLKPGAVAPFYGWEPVQPPEYVEHFTAAGFAAGAEYLSIAHDDDSPLVDRRRPALEQALARGYRFRPFDTGRFLEHEVPILYRISMAAFADAHLFEPIPLEFFRELYVPIVSKLDLSLCFFMLDPEGREVAFKFAFFDDQHPTHYIGKTMALLPEVQGLGLSNAAACHGFTQARQRGSTRGIHAMIWANNDPSRTFQRNMKIDWEHHYLLMEKTL